MKDHTYLSNIFDMKKFFLSAQIHTWLNSELLVIAVADADSVVVIFQDGLL